MLNHTKLGDRLGNSPKERIVNSFVTAYAVVGVAWHLYFAYTNPVSQVQQAIIHFGLMLPVFYLVNIEFDPQSQRDYLNNAFCYGLAVVSFLLTTFVYTNFWRWMTDARNFHIYSNIDLLVGALIILVLIHATWKAYGKVLGLVAVFAFIYGYAGPLFPGILNHSGISIERLIFMNTIALEGSFGFLMQVGATWVVIFILFAGLVEGYGGLDYLASLGQSLSRKLKSTLLLIVISTSFVVGSIMGGSVSNVATTGSFTIPMMKDQKVPAPIAAGIESVASTGGQILPPVMGTAAFIMADILGIPYFDVIVGAIFPALLFYVPVLMTVQLAALKNGWGQEEIKLSMEQQEAADARHGLLDHLIESAPYIGSFTVLLYVLIELRYDPLTAGMYTIFTLLALSFLRDLALNGVSLSSIYGWARDTATGARIGVVNMAPLTAVIGMLGLVIQIVTRTGFAQQFSFTVITAGGDIALIVFVLVAASSIIFGLGMPTPAAYIIVAVIGAPALVRFGVEPLVGHLFVFYFALLSTITPPVALSVAVGSSIAEADFLESCKETLRLGGHTFVIPFVFIYNPEIVIWSGIDTVIVLSQSAVGLLVLSMAMAGYNFRRNLGTPARLIYVTVALIILFNRNISSFVIA